MRNIKSILMLVFLSASFVNGAIFVADGAWTCY